MIVKNLMIEYIKCYYFLVYEIMFDVVELLKKDYLYDIN